MRNRWHNAKRILAIRLDSLGDVLMTSPAIAAIKSLPSPPHITLLTSPSGVDIARLIDEIDEVWCAEVAWLKHTPSRSNGQYERQLIERIRAAQFDAAIIFTVLTQNPLPSALLCYLADVPLRLAYCRENPYQLLTDWVRDQETIEHARHEVQRQLDLVSTIGATVDDSRLRLHVSSTVQYDVQAWLQLQELSARGRWCVIHPGATAASRRYPTERWQQVVRGLEQAGFRCLVTGDRKEHELASDIVASSTSALNVAGRFDVEQLAALISNSPLLLSGNTGPAHMAAAVGTPVVSLYALTNPQHTPWQVPCRIVNVDVPCRNCLKSVCPEGHHACLSHVSPDDVIAAALDLWKPASVPNASSWETTACIH